MQPRPEILGRFQEAYRQEFGEEISLEEAREELVNLSEFLRLVLKRPSQRIDHTDPAPDTG